MRRSLLLACSLLGLIGLKAWGQDTLSRAEIISDRSRAVPRARIEGARLQESDRLADALRSFAGLQVKDYGGIAGIKTLNVRSLGSEHTGVYLDGLAIDQAQHQQVDLGKLSLWGLDEIALYTAQQAHSLPSAREFGHAASLYLTRSIPRDNGVRTRIGLGEFGQLGAALMLERVFRGGWALRLSGEYERSRGDYPYRLRDSLLRRENGDMTAFRIEGEGFRKTPHSEAKWHLYTYQAERGLPGPVVRRAHPFPLSAERQRDCDYWAQGSWSGHYGPYSLALRGKWAYDDLRYNTHPERNPMALPYDNRYRQHNLYFSASQQLSDGAHYRLSLAGDLLYQGLRADAAMAAQPQRWGLFAAAAAEAFSQRGSLALSLLYTRARDHFREHRIGGFDKEDALRTGFFPALELQYRLWQDGAGRGQLQAEAYLKRSYRLPSFQDLYYTLVGNVALRSEKAIQSGAALRYNGVWGPLSLQGRAEGYYNRVRDKIVALPTYSLFRWTLLNLKERDLPGAEIALDTRLRLGAAEREVGLLAQYTGAYGEGVPYVPRHSASVTVHGQWGAWRAGLTGLFNGQRFSTTARTADYRLAPFTSWDARLSRQVSLGPVSGKLSAQIHNLSASRYEIVQGYPMPGRYASFSIDLHF